MDHSMGIKLREMSDAELDECLIKIGKAGGKQALAEIGLSDEYAATDIRAIRDLLKGFRIFKKEAWTVTIRGAGRIIGWAFVLMLAGLMFKHGGPSIQEVAKQLVEP